jgi:hypothetical protein
MPTPKSSITFCHGIWGDSSRSRFSKEIPASQVDFRPAT